MGAADVAEDERPVHRVHVSEFFIGRFPVTQDEYARFVRATGHPAPAVREPPLIASENDELFRDLAARYTWHDEAPPDGQGTHPVVLVKYEDAAAYCRWLTDTLGQVVRLPTEAEWEKAARGSEGNLFPWGHGKPERGLAVFGQYHVHEIPLVAAVNSGEEGQSPYGLRHMAGNVAEWVQDWFGFDYYAIMPDRNPPGPTSGRYKGVRGGSWKSRPNLLRAATRNGGFPDQRSATVGFRCAKSGS